jgi:hypothetical protein
MRFTTQTTTTINPMIPRTNQTIRLISTSFLDFRCTQLSVLTFGGFLPAGSAPRTYSGAAVGGG